MIHIGDKVTIRSKEWVERNCKRVRLDWHGEVLYYYKGEKAPMNDEMQSLCGNVVRVRGVDMNVYRLEGSIWGWKDWMFEKIELGPEVKLIEILKSGPKSIRSSFPIILENLWGGYYIVYPVSVELENANIIVKDKDGYKRTVSGKYCDQILYLIDKVG